MLLPCMPAGDCISRAGAAYPTAMGGGVAQSRVCAMQAQSMVRTGHRENTLTAATLLPRAPEGDKLGVVAALTNKVRVI